MGCVVQITLPTYTCRSIARPHLRPMDRTILVLLARLAPTWRGATLLVQPATILRWHREGFRLLWRRRSKKPRGRPQIPTETIDLIKRMARNNRLWGAERIRGELLKLGIGRFQAHDSEVDSTSPIPTAGPALVIVPANARQ